MKALKTILVITSLISPLISFSQSGTPNSKETTSQSQKSYQKKTSRKTTVVGTSSADTIKKENSPILEDDGTVNSTGFVDGSRSSTGRPDADTMVNYSVKKSKRTIRNGRETMKDSTKRKRDDR